jgi:subtilisin family serine protease
LGAVIKFGREGKRSVEMALLPGFLGRFQKMRTILLSAVAGFAVLAAAQPAAAQRAGDKIANRHICVFKKDRVSRDRVDFEAKRAAGAHGGQVTETFRNTVRGFAANMSDQAAARLKANDPSIAYCEQEQIFTIGQIRGSRITGGSTQPPQETPWGIGRVGGGGPNGTFATAWVLDTGIAYGHPDLNIDTARSRSFVRDTNPSDFNGHGTHVAGTIAARNNTIGVIGVAPGARVVSVRVLDRRGSGTTSGVIRGVDYVGAAGQAGDVANMSLGGGASQALDDAVIAAAARGIRFALAAGNESSHANTSSPGRANGANVYTVSAFQIGDRLASFSNYGNPPVDFSEPGVSIKSTWLNGGYNTISGTSMATPHLAGLLLYGAPRSGGTITGDRDSTPDVIGVK